MMEMQHDHSCAAQMCHYFQKQDAVTMMQVGAGCEVETS